jgi:hypothetical protein
MGRVARVDKQDAGHVGGRYRLVERLGTGGMSVVWRGYDEVLGRHVAVKVLSPRLADDHGFRERLRQEALAAAGLCHPHITGIFDYGESTLAGVTVPYVVMELNDGESISSRLTRRGPLPWRQAVTVAAEIASALATAHLRGVVHRDVTPANVMLTSSGAKVVDFGISALIGERDAAPDGSLLGTPAYLAPERLVGGHVSPATDVYALGLLLYRSLTGRLPWPAETTTEALRAHLYADPEPIPSQPGMPADVAELCLGCLAKDPHHRPGAAEMAHALAGAVGLQALITPLTDAESSPVPAPVTPLRTVPVGTSLAVRVRRPAPRRGWLGRALFAGQRRVNAIAATVALLALVGVSWVSAQEPTDVGPAQAAAIGTGQAAVGVLHSTRCRVRYQVRRDSGTAFDVSLIVTNIGDNAVGGWLLEFAFPGNQRLIASTGPAGQVEQRGRQVSVRAGTLRPGKEAEISLRGAYRLSNPLPLAFTVDGRACQAEVLGTAVAGPAPATAGDGQGSEGSGDDGADGSAGRAASQGGDGAEGSASATGSASSSKASTPGAGSAGRNGGPAARIRGNKATVDRARKAGKSNKTNKVDPAGKAGVDPAAGDRVEPVVPRSSTDIVRPGRKDGFSAIIPERAGSITI